MRKKNVAILAPTGMLGNMVYNVLKDTHNLILVYKNEDKLKKLNQVYGGVDQFKKIQFDFTKIYDDYQRGFPDAKLGTHTTKLVKQIGHVDCVINCTGITKPHSLKNPLNTLFINTCVPTVLSMIYKEKLIQITTDCVFNGITGAPYNEDSLKTPNDLYGLSKSLGEPKESLVLRTSIIGPEISDFVMILEWFKQQEGKTIKGFVNHIWNGITTKQLALVCDAIIRNRSAFPAKGVFHIFSTTITKYDMLKKFRDKYGIYVRIVPIKATPVDRRLSSKYNFCKNLKIPDFDDMLKDL